MAGEVRQIGALTFDAMQGAPVPAAGGVEQLAPLPGESYARYRLVGQRVRSSRLTTLKVVADAAGLAAEIAAQQALQGEAVCVWDAHGNAHPNCVITGVEPDGGKAGIGPAGACILLTTVWTVEQGYEA
jgi:hypothetical protein